MDETIQNSHRLPANVTDRVSQYPTTEPAVRIDTLWPGPQPPEPVTQMNPATMSPSVVGSMAFPAATNSTGSQHVSNLPPADVVVDLVELFFRHIYPWAPLFEKVSFLSTMWQREMEPLLHGIVVCATRFWDKMVPAADVMLGHLQASRDRLTLCCLETSSLVTTQALALLAIDALAHGPGTKIWMIRSMLNAAVQQLSLSKESLRTPEVTTPMVGNEGLDNIPETSNLATEERRRLFWTMFSIDHFASVALGQPSCIPARTIKLHYPNQDTHWYGPPLSEWFQASAPIAGKSSGHAWRHYVDILTLLDRSNRLLVHPYDLSHPAKRQEWQSHFRMMTVTLSTWLETCAEQCRSPNQGGFDAMWTIVRATYEL
jgi:hypothetical protein